MSHRRQTLWQLWLHLADKFIWLIGLGSCYQIFWWESIIFGFITKGKSHGEEDDQRGITRGKKNRADVACLSAREFSFGLYRRMYELLEFPLSKICPVWIFFFIFHFFWMNRIFHIASATCKRCVLASFWFCPRDTKRARTLHTWASLGKAASSSFRPATAWCLNNYIAGCTMTKMARTDLKVQNSRPFLSQKNPRPFLSQNLGATFFPLWNERRYYILLELQNPLLVVILGLKFKTWKED